MFMRHLGWCGKHFLGITGNGDAVDFLALLESVLANFYRHFKLREPDLRVPLWAVIWLKCHPRVG